MPTFCENCGKSIPDDVKFCPECGAKTSDASNGTQPPISQQTPQVSTTVTPPKKRSTVEWIAIGCGGIILLLIFAAVFSAVYSGRSSTTSSSYNSPVVPTSKIDLVRIESITDSRNEYNWIVFKGIIVNDDSKSHSVGGYIDLYDKNDVKIDHLLIFENVDAYGKTSFETTSTKAENYLGSLNYKYYIDHVY
jgi:hypothetical protein